MVLGALLAPNAYAQHGHGAGRHVVTGSYGYRGDYGYGYGYGSQYVVRPPCYGTCGTYDLALPGLGMYYPQIPPQPPVMAYNQQPQYQVPAPMPEIYAAQTLPPHTYQGGERDGFGRVQQVPMQSAPLVNHQPNPPYFSGADGGLLEIRNSAPAPIDVSMFDNEGRRLATFRLMPGGFRRVSPPPEGGYYEADGIVTTGTGSSRATVSRGSLVVQPTDHGWIFNQPTFTTPKEGK